MPSRDSSSHDLVFVTAASSADEMLAVRLMVESVRTFGGDLGMSPVWVFGDEQRVTPSDLPSELGTCFHSLEMSESIRGYELAEKVAACAEAERLASPEVRALVWMNSDTLVVNPPNLYELGETHDAALRPVHIRNVGMPVGMPLDGFWQRVMECAGIQDTDYWVESFVDRARIRAYFNSHSYCVNPSIGLFRDWLRCFEELVRDPEFQSLECADELHRIFLHQAVLSALTVARVDPERIRLLPPTYCYPYNLNDVIPPERRASSLDELVSVVYEEQSLNPNSVKGIELREPLRSWLADRTC